ncbi:hypothetical protein ACFZAV_21845 [Streptomyces sp. NPDC008343]|uniref:hypothetical protein n=1 Tax=Streptomyces sp. NPDC008343 TaxID=3364828 RepID=UPI0036EDF6A3
MLTLVCPAQESAVPVDPAVVSVESGLADVVTLQRRRQARILNEAFTTGDPLKLMRLFGITEATAMRYVTAAYPERTAKLPQ